MGTMGSGLAFPFIVQGGSFASKVLGLEQEDGNFSGPLGDVTVKLRVRAGGEVLQGEAQFGCGERTIEAGVFHYCRRKP